MSKSKSKTYKFLFEDKSIEDIKNQPNITFKEKRRHGGSTFKLIEKKNANMQQLSDDLSETNVENSESASTSSEENDDIEEINSNMLLKLKNYLGLQKNSSLFRARVRLEMKIESLEKENAELKKEIENLKQTKQENVNLPTYAYNCVTSYDEKQSKKSGITKIHEEILQIEDKIILITTFVHTNQTITEEIMYFYEYDNEIEVIKQLKYYENINKYKADSSLFAATPNYEKNIKIEAIPIKDFLIKQNNVKVKPTKLERGLWWFFTGAAVLAIALPIIIALPAVAIIPALALKIKIVCGIMAGGRIFSSLFSAATKKVDSWYGNKVYKSKEEKEKDKKIRLPIIRNLTSHKLETKLETQYDVLKQEFDNRKTKKPDKLISKNKIHNATNDGVENSYRESLNTNNFDSLIRANVNQEHQMLEQGLPLLDEAQTIRQSIHM